jgi:hypothetical protein
MPKRRKLCLAAIIAETVAQNHRPRTYVPAPQRCRRDGTPHGSWPDQHLASGAPRLDAGAYAAQMIRIEGQRNAACRQGDVETLRLVAERHAWLNYRFWGRALN